LRPLPDLSDLPDVGSFFDPNQDDLVKHISDDLAQYNSLTASLDQQQNDLAVTTGGVGSAIDTIDAIGDAAGSVFDSLSAELEAIDLTPTILESVALNDALAAALSDETFDLAGLATDLLNQVHDIVNQAVSNITVNVYITIINRCPTEPSKQCDPFFEVCVLGP
jgi:hypothetical protein